jgi:hypothetical protein
MKTLITKITALIFLIATSTAFAHPGGHSLTCKSAVKSGSKQRLEFTLSRSNGTGWYAPSFSVTVNGQKTEIETADETRSYGETFHNSPLGVITVSANNMNGTDLNEIWAHITAIPSTVKAFDSAGKTVKWSFKKEQDECSDANGSAKFKGIIHGYLRTKANQPEKTTDINLETQIMDCELTYNSGMAC